MRALSRCRSLVSVASGALALSTLSSIVAAAPSATNAAAAVSAVPPPLVACAVKGQAAGRFDRFGRPRPTSTIAPAAPTLGPCLAADSVGVLPPTGAFPPVFLSNFGLLFEQAPGEFLPPRDSDAGPATGGRRYGYVCEENFGGKMPDRLARHPDGRLFVAAFDGLHVSPANGCGYVRAAGSVAFQDVVEVGFDAVDHNRVFALTRAPAALHVSSDGGGTFALREAATAGLPSDLRLSRLFVLPPQTGAPAAPPTLILTGYAAGADPLVVVVAPAGGESVSVARVASDIFAEGRPPGTTAGLATQVDAIDPSGSVMLLTVGASTGADEIWRSRDFGRSWTRILTLRGTELRAGAVFGRTANDVYIAGREPFTGGGAAGAHLYVSHDGGTTFAAPVPSGPQGPHHRCLAAADGRLYSCGGPPSDAFLFGVSADEGRSWTPLASLADIDGPRGCTSGRCLATAFWLCEAYGVCAADLPRNNIPESQGDGGSADVGGTDANQGEGEPESGSCGCRVGAASVGAGGGRGAFAGWLVLVSAVHGALLRRGHRRGSRSSPQRLVRRS